MNKFRLYLWRYCGADLQFMNLNTDCNLGNVYACGPGNKGSFANLYQTCSADNPCVSGGDQ
jgi:hypothetical protein